MTMRERVAQYATVRLTTDLSALTPNERRMLPLLIEAARQMDRIFWLEAYGEPEPLLASLRDPDTRRFVEINYGPWDRLADNAPFVEGFGPKPPGANFYPHDLTKAEFEQFIKEHPDQAAAFKSQYSVIRRDAKAHLTALDYHEQFAEPVRLAVAALRQAAALAEDSGLRRYLELRADALLTDDYRASDLAWLEMKDNTIDCVIGPIETYEDQLFGYKAAHEAYVLVKDKAWSARLAKYAALLPGLQRGLPVPEAYKRESPGTGSDLNAYDVVYYAGDCNAGSKTIAINLPNDEEIQLRKGARRLQLKNAMRAKFDKILVPIADLLIAPEQRRHVTFDAFFGDTMFHEVAHGLGIKQTINGRGTVREALRDLAGTIEEGKADILGLYMIGKLLESGDLKDGSIEDYYVTFLAGIFRSVRFGAASAHGRANMLRFNYFAEAGAFSRDRDGRYRVNVDPMRKAVESLSAKILTLQGDGDYDGAAAWMRAQGELPRQLAADLGRVSDAAIPVDIVFEQGSLD
ncbi:MAG: Zn-dependent hydrolase [Phycisphaerae bacterium]|nr:Zn-dependent hydrolase [Phycisphaerae bacterium]